MYALLTICLLTACMTVAPPSLGLLENTQASKPSDLSRYLTSGTVKMATPGDIAEGVVVREEEGELDLDIDPQCRNQVMRFHEPYVKEVIGEVYCPDGTHHDKVQVEQK